MPVGAGFSPMGVSIAGYGGVDAAPIQEQTILIDSNTGIAQNSRKVDPITGQYVYDTLDRVEGMSGIEQLVMLRAGTLIKSSAVFTLGMAAPSGVIGSSTQRKLEDDIRLAMKDLVDAKLIKIVSVSINQVPGGGGHVIRRFFTWQDTSTGIEQDTQF